MNVKKKNIDAGLPGLFNRVHLKLRPKLIIVFVSAMVIPIILLTSFAWTQMGRLGSRMRDIAVEDSGAALTESAVESIERLTTETAGALAAFLYARDDDISLLSRLNLSDDTLRDFSVSRSGFLTQKAEWVLSEDLLSWTPARRLSYQRPRDVSSNPENNQKDAFHFTPPPLLERARAPLYDEITYIDLLGNEVYKYVSPDSPKKNHPMDPAKKSVAEKKNTYVMAESYFEKLKALKPGEIYVSDVIGAYVGTNYIGMYAPGRLRADNLGTHPNARLLDEIGRSPLKEFDAIAREQAYAGMENPNGTRFEGVIRWATPVTDGSGAVTGYVTMALNHDHIMEFVDYITPMRERYTELPNAFEGNYAFIWDYKCRNICHPRHHSIVGFDPLTGEPQIPWLETTIYEAWKASGADKWTDFISGWPEFDRQSRSKAPARELTAAGLVGLDGRYLNNAPQCTGWMDLTENGGSGSFYILWSGLEKLTTAAAIPYYTGQYAPSEENNYSKRGFGFVTIGAGLEDFNKPAREIETKLTGAINAGFRSNVYRLMGMSAFLFAMVAVMAIALASFINDNIEVMLNGISRFKAGEWQFRLSRISNDEFGELTDSFNDMADSVVSSVSNPLSIIDMDHKVIYMNEPSLRVIEKTLEEVIGVSYDAISLYDIGSNHCPITALEQGREADVLFVEEYGLYFKGVASYLTDSDGRNIGYIIVSNDVTEIEEARKKAEQASVAKSSFLSNMSHEMRTPMNAIIGMTSIGMSAPDIEKKDYALVRIEDASKHLLGVINDILDMSKIEANKFELFVTEFDFEKVIRRVVDVIIFRVEEKRQRLTIHLDKRVPEKLIGDDQRLAQVITNLLSNAVKFTPVKGAIHLDAGLVSEDNGVCEIKISITDTGIGINEEQLSRLFSSFEQAEASTSRKYGGTGLGLVISKNIVEMMNGAIWVDSEPGKGSTFTFTARMFRGPHDRRGLTDPDSGMEKISALAVDDAPDTLSFFEGAAARTGMKCDIAGDGKQARELVSARGAYDIYFINRTLPDMDGIELSREINPPREINPAEAGNPTTGSPMTGKSTTGSPTTGKPTTGSPTTGKPTTGSPTTGKLTTGSPTVLLVSATEWVSIQDEARDAGITCFLSKPLFLSSLMERVSECLGLRRDEARIKPDAIPDFEGCRLLLAEDMEINREIVIALLEDTKIEIDCAVNGVEAVKMFVDDPRRYDMIFMDLQMPEMDGFTATQRIRASKADRASSIPIVAMTANVFKEDIDKCLEAGMNGHIGKPLSIDEVINTLTYYLRQL